MSTYLNPNALQDNSVLESKLSVELQSAITNKADTAYVDAEIAALDKSVVLYNVDINSTNFGDVTLSDSAANYEYFDIFCATDDKHCIWERVYQPDGKMVSFSASLVGHTNYFTKCKVYAISGNIMTTGTYGESKMAGLWGTHNSTSFERNESYVGCYRVIGYKK